MTAVSSVEEYDNRGTRECDLRVARVIAGRQTQWTPTNSSGKTIRLIGAYEEVGGPVVCTVSSGVILLDTGNVGGANATYNVIYTLT